MTTNRIAALLKPNLRELTESKTLFIDEGGVYIRVTDSGIPRETLEYYVPDSTVEKLGEILNEFDCEFYYRLKDACDYHQKRPEWNKSAANFLARLFRQFPETTLPE